MDAPRKSLTTFVHCGSIHIQGSEWAWVAALRIVSCNHIRYLIRQTHLAQIVLYQCRRRLDMLMAIRTLALLLSIFVCPVSANSEEAKNVTKNSEISVGNFGTLSTRPGANGEGVVAQFKRGAKPLSSSCSGRCGDRWSGSWTCPDGKSCFLNCSSSNPAQCN